MTIIEAINRVDEIKHNTYSQPEKVKWLSTLDAMVKRTVIDTHEGGEDISFHGYDADTSTDTVLLVEQPHDEMYLRWLEAQIDYSNREFDSYNNAIEMFNATWTAFRNYYNATHLPKSKGLKYF